MSFYGHINSFSDILRRGIIGLHGKVMLSLVDSVVVLMYISQAIYESFHCCHPFQHLVFSNF